MAEITDDTTKLVIYGLGIGTLLFFAYLIYKDFRQPTQPTQPLEQQRKYGFMTDTETSGFEQIEQRLLQLESKIDSFTKLNATISSGTVKSLNSQPEQTQRKVVSIGSKLSPISDNKRTRAEFFGML